MVNGKVLLVDDENIFLISHKKELESGGFTVTLAHDGPEAIASAKKENFHVVYVDLVLPKMNGVEICRQLKGILPTAEIVLVSGHPDEIQKYQMEFIYAGGKDLILRKPLLDQELLRVTESIVSRKNGGAETRILVVDDVQIECVALKKVLKEAGYDADAVLSGTDAVRAAGQKAYDIVLMDLVMPDMDGIQACREFKEVSPDSTVVMFTGKIDNALSENEMAFTHAGGRIHYLYKPLEADVLLSMVRKILAERNAENRSRAAAG
ncbi:MAG: response regulator [Candidatus Omnitrophota bacterium]|nr:response regulator [Candidatus Omnitrophota bacterium]